MDAKKCIRCGSPVPPSKGCKPTRYCSRRCVRIAHYERDPKKQNERCKNWRTSNPEKYRQSKRNWAAKNPLHGKLQYQRKKRYFRNGQMRRKYGFTIEVYEQECARRNNLCDICKRDPGKDQLKVDHCHRTGKVRGFLCKWCNVGLGSFRDNPAALRAAADYLNAATSVS